MKPFDLRKRTFEFGVRILDVTSSLPAGPETMVVRTQLSKSGTSVGANVEEADGALTKADARKAFVIARKEARESRYWLRIVQRKWSEQAAVEADITEADELVCILSAIIRKLS